MSARTTPSLRRRAVAKLRRDLDEEMDEHARRADMTRYPGLLA